MTTTSGDKSARERPDGPIGIAILGSTGSIGQQTLEVIDAHPERFRVVALAAGRNIEVLRRQIARYKPELIALEDDRVLPQRPGTAIVLGEAGLIEVATHPDADIVVVATSGHAAMRPTHQAIAAGKTIALANKETIVCAGELIMPFAAARGVQIRPIDSEHSAIWRCLGQTPNREVARLILTASGGPFRETPAERLATVTVAEALAHPTWAMGGKVTIDSATLMNKGLEIIEARWLFDLDYARIDVLIHPESIIHSLVEFVDGSQLAQLSTPDMRMPIQFALTYPEHVAGPAARLSLAAIGQLTFAFPDETRFPALTIARHAAIAGSTYPTVLSAADDVAVSAFMKQQIRFVDIPEVVARVLAEHRPDGPLGFDAIAAADHWAQMAAEREIRALIGSSR
jgi:1-deoxy-D-xylulose-5-phosphate reductoisomerase